MRNSDVYLNNSIQDGGRTVFLIGLILSLWDCIKLLEDRITHVSMYIYENS